MFKDDHNSDPWQEIDDKTNFHTKDNILFPDPENIENNKTFFGKEVLEDQNMNLSEKDRTELERCINVANKYRKSENYSKAISFLNKAYNIYPSSAIIQLLNDLKQENQEHDDKIRATQDRESKLKSKEEAKKKLEEERQKLCQQILKAQNINEALSIDIDESNENALKLLKATFKKIHPDKINVSNPDDFKRATQILNDFKEDLERKLGTQHRCEIESETVFKDHQLCIEDEKSEESVSECSNSDDSYTSFSSDEGFEEVRNRQRKYKRTNFFDFEYNEDLENYIINFDYDQLSTNPSAKEISNEFDDIDHYNTEFMSAFFVELHEIIKKEIYDIDKFNAYSLILESDGCVYTVSGLNKNISLREFNDEVQLNDLLVLVPFSKSKISDSIKNEHQFLLGIVKKSHISGSIYIQTKLKKVDCNKFNIAIIGNLTTLKREFLAFSKLQDSLLLDYILFPKRAKFLECPIVSESFIRTIREKYNSAQYDALYNIFCMNEGLSLVEGPPGTGKTNTILGLISGYLSIDAFRRKKILVCAPSNDAIDEIASRAHKFDELFDKNGDHLTGISLLRIGQKRLKNELGVLNNTNRKNILSGVKDISLNYLTETKLNRCGIYDPSEIIKIKQKELKPLKCKQEKMFEEGKSSLQKYIDLSMMIEILENELKVLYDEKKDFLDYQRKFRKHYIDKADIVFCTTSTAGASDLLIAFYPGKDEIALRKFDYLIIDEACQSVELSMLIPFLYDTSTVALFGDPKQLPATTFSNNSRTNKYSRSLFERIMDCGIKPFLLNIQYRMTTEICEYPNMYFYDHLLKSDPGVNKRPVPSGIKKNGLWFFNLISSIELKDEIGHSLYNASEADYITNNMIEYIGDAKIGIITPYRAQVETIKSYLDQRFGSRDYWSHNIEVNSVDGFQGKEKDYIIVSLVRSENIGFLRDRRRMNVAITRAKFALHVVGNASCLRRNSDWDDFIDYCNNKKRLVTIDWQGEASRQELQRVGNFIPYSDYFGNDMNGQNIMNPCPSKFPDKNVEKKIKSKTNSNLGFKEVAINIGAANRRKEERKKEEEAKIPPKPEKKVQEKNIAIQKKTSKVTNGSIGGGFWNRRK